MHIRLCEVDRHALYTFFLKIEYFKFIEKVDEVGINVLYRGSYSNLNTNLIT